MYKFLLTVFCCTITLTVFSQEKRTEFIAMQYFGIFNKSFIVQISDSLIFAGRVQGSIAAGVSRRYPKKLLDDPYFYANRGLLSNYELEGNQIHPELVKLDKANFIISRQDILEVTYSKKRKWGMGDVVHSGKLFLHLKNGKKIEFILLGRPNVDAIINALNARILNE